MKFTATTVRFYHVQFITISLASDVSGKDALQLAMSQTEAERKRAEYWRRRDEIRTRRAQRRRERKLAGTLPPRKVYARANTALARREKSEYDARRYAREKADAMKQADSLALNGFSLVADNWFTEYHYKIVAPSGRIAVERGRFDEAAA